MDLELFSKETKGEDIGSFEEGPNLYKSLSFISFSLSLYSVLISLSALNCHIFIVITVSRHDLEDHKNNNRVATDLFCTGMIGHPGYMFLN